MFWIVWGPEAVDLGWVAGGGGRRVRPSCHTDGLLLNDHNTDDF